MKKRIGTCICITESLWYTPETNIPLLINCTPIYNKRLKKKKANSREVRLGKQKFAFLLEASNWSITGERVADWLVFKCWLPPTDTQWVRPFKGKFQGYEDSAYQCRRLKRCRFEPWVWKNPWSSKWQPTLVFLPSKFHGQRNLMSYSSQGCKEQMTKRISTMQKQPKPWDMWVNICVLSQQS